jgi:hypothetical protein
MSGDDFSGDAAQYAELAQEMAQPSTEDMWGAPPEELPLDQAEYEQGVRQANDGHAQFLEQRRQERQQQAQQPRQEIPSTEEDPIGHFSHRMAQMEWHAGQKHFVDAVEHSERQARELISDYDEACEHLETGRMRELEMQYPDNHPQAKAIARHYGYPSPAHLRAACLNADRVNIVKHAMQTGQSPAQLYYKIAIMRGFQARPAINRHESRQMDRLYEENPEAWDRAFDQLAKNGRL